MAANTRHASRSLRFTHVAATAALVLFVAALLSETARALGYLDTNTRVVRVSFVLFAVLAVAAAIIEHYIAATRDLQRMNAELERRLAERAQEAELRRTRIENANHELALARERGRILADMHDGIGACLVALLRHVQAAGANRESIERRVQEALQEMRIAVDALQPQNGDLAAVLGSLRYRIDDSIRAAGMQLAWEVEELPDVGTLEPATVFSLQRILLEGITNAVKHSGAQCVGVSACSLGSSIEISLVDDGRGFDYSRPATGLGLQNMQARAQSIGARLEIQSRPGKGTALRLYVPLDLGGAYPGNGSPSAGSPTRLGAGSARKAA